MYVHRNKDSNWFNQQYILKPIKRPTTQKQQIHARRTFAQIY